MKELNVTEQILYDELKNRSSDNPLPRWELKDITKSSDRQSRQMIEHLRDNGIRVINDTRGYWIGTDSEYKAWVSHYTAYAYTILDRVRKMNQYTEGQMQI